MQAFSDLYEALDASNKTNAKVAALVQYFCSAEPADAAWAVAIIAGRRAKRLVSRPLLKKWLIEATGYPEWMVEDAYATVGDFAETVALLTENTKAVEEKESSQQRQSELDKPLHQWMDNNILGLRIQPELEQATTIQYWWLNLPKKSCFLVTKLMTGGLRVGVSQILLARALAESFKLPKEIIQHRLMGDWEPTVEFFEQLVDPNLDRDLGSQPYPFYLASPLEKEVKALGDINNWLCEWKWDGIRAQLVKRGEHTALWSRGEDLITERFPEISQQLAPTLNDCVIDGEILAWREGGVRPFSELQKRLGRKTVGAKLLKDIPVKFLAYDCLEVNGQDLRKHPLHERRTILEGLIKESEYCTLSPVIEATSWQALAEQRDESRVHWVEGIMLKEKASPYETGRKKGAWWKWKIEPLTLDAIMIYAQAGSGRRATLFTDYTFALWDGDALVPIAKAYSGLSDKEINQLNHWIRKNTRERFGPVRSVEPFHVFELAFEGINASSRHKSGIALRFPRIARWRSDMKASDANTLAQARDLLALYGTHSQDDKAKA